MNAGSKIYFDYNATTPVDQRALDAMMPYFNRAFGNPSSSGHPYGWEAEEAVELAREQTAELIGASPGEIYFTSGATEAANLAIKGLCGHSSNRGNHLITCATEHKAVLETCRSLEEAGYRLTWLPVDENGAIDPGELEDAITDDTALVALMQANNETGTIHPIDRIAEITRAHNIPLFTDATQAVGKIPVDVKQLGADMLAFSSHKLYGPKGAGALYISRDGKPDLAPILHGGAHEKGLRPGTLNVPGIVGFGKACELCAAERQAEAKRLGRLRDRLELELSELEGILFNGAKGNRLPHTTSISFGDIDGSNLLRQLKGLALSQGSACSSATQKPSHVLKAMGHSDELARSTIRISLGRPTTGEEINYAIETIKEVIPQLKLSSS